jgi:hypothetical protein
MPISRQPWYHAPIVAGVAGGPAAAACSAASGSGWCKVNSLDTERRA